MTIMRAFKPQSAEAICEPAHSKSQWDTKLIMVMRFEYIIKKNCP